jgi:hypothetical protein
MKFLLDVPYISQYSLGRDPDGKSRSCGAACVYMILEYRGQTRADFLSILKEAQTIKGAFISGIGWTQVGLAALLRNHNVGAYGEEFRSVHVDVESQEFLPSEFEAGHIERGMQKIAGKVIDWKEPVIISGIKNWNEEDKPHLMLVVGVEAEGDIYTKERNIKGFYFHDPDDEHAEGKNRFVDIDTFRNHWRKFAIFVD